MSYRGLTVWRALKRNPFLGAADLAEVLGWTTNVTTKVLSRLRVDGCVTMYGRKSSHSTEWVATNKVPKDKRGRAPGTLAALRPYQQFAHARLKKANEAKGAKMKAPPIPKPAIALELYWPVSPVVVRIGQMDD